MKLFKWLANFLPKQKKEAEPPAPPKPKAPPRRECLVGPCNETCIRGQEDEAGWHYCGEAPYGFWLCPEHYAEDQRKSLHDRYEHPLKIGDCVLYVGQALSLPPVPLLVKEVEWPQEREPWNAVFLVEIAIGERFGLLELDASEIVKLMEKEHD